MKKLMRQRFLKKEKCKCVSYNRYLYYDFTYEGQRHKGRILLDDVTPNLEMFYDDHELEIVWFKQIRHKGKHLILNITVNDDANNPDMCGKVVASAWVCVYSSADDSYFIDEFEPKDWSYTDEAYSSNDVSRSTFYVNWQTK